MTTDLYALLDECAEALDHSLQCLMDDRSLEHPLAVRIRAAQPQQQELPTDAELLDLFFEHSTEFGYQGVGITEDDALAFARAALARWGRPAPAPIPVAERWPRQEDCDAEVRCWIYMPDIATAPSWRLAQPRDIGPFHTHWLPADALPLPGSGEASQ